MALVEWQSAERPSRSDVAVGGAGDLRKKRLAFHFSLPKLGLVPVEFTYRGQRVDGAGIDFIKQLIAQNPGLSRRRLSTKLCQAWNWVQANGHPRDMVCRGLMLGLHRAGLIELPVQRYLPPNPLARDFRRRLGHG